MGAAMIERAAKAIFTADNSDRPGLSWDDDTKDWERDEYRAMARAAIHAMREPTEVMVNKAVRDEGAEVVWAIIHWRCMIDAALNGDGDDPK